MKYSLVVLIATALWTEARCAISRSADTIPVETSQHDKPGWDFSCSAIYQEDMSTESLKDSAGRDETEFSTRSFDSDRSVCLGKTIGDGILPRGLHEDSRPFRYMIRSSTLGIKSILARCARRKWNFDTSRATKKTFRKLYDKILDEFQINTTTDGQNSYPTPVIFEDGTGGVFWVNSDTEIVIRGQLFDIDWNKVGAEFEVSTSVIPDTVPIKIAVLASGSYVVCWLTTDDKIYARIFNKNMSQGPEFQVNSSNYISHVPNILALDNGGFLIVWHYEIDSQNDVYAQFFNQEGEKVGGEFQPTTSSSGDQRLPNLASLSNGNIVLTWAGTGGPDPDDVFGEIFDQEWNSVANEFVVNTYTEYDQSYPQIAALNGGGFLVAWNSYLQDGSLYGVFAQVFNSSGNKIGDELPVNQHIQGYQYVDSAIALSDGGFLISYFDLSGNDGDGYGVFGRRYDQNGNPTANEFQLHQYSDGNQYISRLAATECGFVAVWQSYFPTAPDKYILGRVYYDSIPKLINPVKDFNLIQFQPFSFVVPASTFYTSSGDTLNHSARILIEGEEVLMESFWLAFDETSRTFSGTPILQQTATVQLKASNECGGSAIDEFQITVAPNSKPVANTLIPNQAIPFSREEIWEYYVPKNAFKDLERDQLLFTGAVAVINGEEKDLNTIWESLDFDIHDGELSGIPNLSGNFTIRIYADDRQGDLNPTSLDMTVEIISQGIELLELYQINQRGLKGFISSDGSFFWVSEDSDLKRFNLSSENPLLITDPSINYSLSSSITALAPLSQDRMATGDDQGNLTLLSSAATSLISSISLNGQVTDIYSDDDDFIYVSHGSFLSTIRLTTETLELFRSNTVPMPATSIAKTGDVVYVGTQDGLFIVDTLANTSNDSNISDVGYVFDLQVLGTYLYVLGPYELLIFDASNTQTILQVNKRSLEGLGTSIAVSKIDGDVIVFISEEENGVSLINASDPLNLISEGYYSSISSVNMFCVSRNGIWGLVLKESEVWTVEIFRREIRLHVCDTNSDPCSQELENQAQKDCSKDVLVSELLPTFKTDFIYDLSYSYSIFEVSESVYSSAPEWLSSSKVGNKLFRLSGQPPDYLIGSVVDLEVQAFAFKSDGEKLLTLRKIVSLSIVPRHASLGSLIPDQSLEIGEEWIFSFEESVFLDADYFESEYLIDSEWIKSSDVSFIHFTHSSGRWDISYLDSTKENFFGCDLCNSTDYSTTYLFNVTAKNSASDSDPGVSTSFNLYIYSGRIPDQQTHSGISQTIILDESIFPSGIQYRVSLLNSNDESEDLPWWMSYISNERKILMFPSVSEIDQDFRIQILGNNDEVELSSSFAIQVRNEPPVAIKQLQNQRVKLGESLDFSISSDTFFDSNGDALSYTVEWKKQDGSLTTALPWWITFTESTLTFYGSPSVQESYTLSVIANDGLGGQASTEFEIEAYNNAPLLNPDISFQTQIDHHIGLLFSLTLPFDLFVDQDGDSLSYSALQSDGSDLPSWLIFNPSSLSFSGTPSDFSLIGTPLSIQITASDGYSSSSSFFSIYITNSVPQASEIKNQSVHIGTPFSFTLPFNTFTDEDGDTLEFSVSQGDHSDLPSWLSFSSITHEFSGTPTSSLLENTAVNITVSVTDGYSLVESDFSLSITNEPPILTHSLDSQIKFSLDQGLITFKPEREFNYILSANTFTDSDNDALTFSSRLSNGDPLPVWLNFDPNTQQFYGTPTEVETLSISVTASDGYTSTSDTFEMKVNNQIPTLNNPLQHQVDSLYPDPLAEGLYFSFQFSEDTFIDEDDSLSYSAVFSESGGEWRSLDFIWIELEGRTLFGTVSTASTSNTTLSVSITASDGQESVSDRFSLTILTPFPSPFAEKIRIESMKRSIEVEVSTNGPKIAVFNYATLSVLDISNNNKTNWSIEGSPFDINYVLERVKYRPSPDRVLSESKISLRINGLEQSYSLSVFTPQEPIQSLSIPNKKAYMDNTFSMGMKKYFNYSDESELVYSFEIDKKPKGYKNWLNFEESALSGTPSDPEEVGSYRLKVIVIDEFDESISESFDLTVDYSTFQNLVGLIILISEYIGPAITILGLFVYRAWIWNFFTKNRKLHAPLQLRENQDTRELLILRPDEEEIALKIFRKLKYDTIPEQEELISDMISEIKEINMNKSKKTRKVDPNSYEISSDPSNETLEERLKEDAPMVKIKELNIMHVSFSSA